MFTWIIEKKARITNIFWGNISVENIFWNKLGIGQSIAHDWACMTITSFDEKIYSFFAMEESFSKTNFWEKEVWDFFNIESSLKFSWKVDWHFVTGHVDTVWQVSRLDKKEDNSLVIYIKFDEKFKNNIIEKWSIAINWVSLTIVETWEDFFSVSLIPLTQKITNLWDLKVWNKVNLEFDMIWKYIIKYLGKN